LTDLGLNTLKLDPAESRTSSLSNGCMGCCCHSADASLGS